MVNVAMTGLWSDLDKTSKMDQSRGVQSLQCSEVLNSVSPNECSKSRTWVMCLDECWQVVVCGPIRAYSSVKCLKRALRSPMIRMRCCLWMLSSVCFMAW
eukprot:2078019-Amphidinium_carterae.2